jgi:photosystem II stability/assembly factor-like uncharacterized protein
MSDLTCRTARVWLQEPDALHPIDARHLERHLSGCAACAAYRGDQVRMDRLLLQGLDGTVGDPVHLRVRARLISGEVARPSRAPLGGAWRRWRSGLRLAAMAAPVAVSAVLVALFLPQALQRKGAITPAGAAWHLQHPTIGFPLTVDAAHPRHLLVGAWGQVYQSWNGGESWTAAGRLPAGLIIRDVAVDRSNPAHYLVAAKHSVYTSSDAGHHWALAVSGLQGAMNMFLMQNPRKPATFYAGPSVLWASDDRGRTWYQDGRGAVFAPDGIQSLSIEPNGTLIAGIWAGGVAMSTDGGRTWQRQAVGLRKNVVDVATGPGRRIWAATDRGTYLSLNGGRTWSRRSPHHAFTTAVLDGASFVLAGTTGGLFRSTDGGRHWTFSEQGLPLDPYVNSLTSVPGHPDWVYASLNGDGIFRSTDGGVHWQPAIAGLPIDRQDTSSRSILFIRHGVLWMTNGVGVDPGSITVDADVRSASLSPDGRSAAYVAGNDGRWALRTVCSGCLAYTVFESSGPLPRAPHWSPAATRIAVVQGGTVYVANLAGNVDHWALPPGSVLLGWDHSGRSVLLWNGVRHRVETRAALSGQQTSVWPGVYMHRPRLSADGLSIARVRAGSVWIRKEGGSWLEIPGTRGCTPGAWSDAGAALLVACSDGVQMRAGSGRLIARAPVPASAFWAPGSNRALLYFAGGSLWRWEPGATPSEIVADALPPR